MDQNRVIVLTTGGTFEKSYSEREGSLSNRESQLKHRLLSRLRLPNTEIEVHEIMAKDSLDMTDEDRQWILQKVTEYSKQNVPILVLHGTDTMEQTALILKKNLLEVNAPIVITGAMTPIAFVDSDASQNFSEALMACQLVPSGVYIVFHNQVFEVPNVQKNHRLSTFETKDGKSDARKSIRNR